MRNSENEPSSLIQDNQNQGLEINEGGDQANQGLGRIPSTP